MSTGRMLIEKFSYPIKLFLRNSLTDHQLHSLNRLRSTVINSYNFIIKIFSILLISLLGFISKRLLVEIQERISVIVNIDYKFNDIYLNASSITEYTTRRNSCKKEPETIQWIESYVTQGDVVYDIGANVGAYSLVVDKHSKGRVKIYAFEPSFRTFAQLNKNVLLNSSQGRVIPLYLALSDKTGMDVLNYSSLTPGAALHSLGKAVDQKGNVFTPVLSQPMICIRIDDLIPLFHIEVPNHIKLDVDGIEFEILKGADKTLECQNLRSIMVEMEPSQEVFRLITEYLQSKGFEIKMSRSHGQSSMDTSNYLFTRSLLENFG